MGNNQVKITWDPYMNRTDLIVSNVSKVVLDVEGGVYELYRGKGRDREPFMYVFKDSVLCLELLPNPNESKKLGLI